MVGIFNISRLGITEVYTEIPLFFNSEQTNLDTFFQ